MRRDAILVALIVTVALFVRVYPAWDAVFGAGYVDFLETDAWYHVRIAENQVRHYPWRPTIDPYAAPGGEFVPIAPLFDTITSTLVVLAHGRDAGTREVERVAAFVPPALGALTVIVTFAAGRRIAGRRAGLIAAALLAILPGHFLDRTQLGFVDHHALEALLAIATLWTIAIALDARGRGPQARLAQRGAIAGVALGLYLLAWGSGAFLIAILGAWMLLLAPCLDREDRVRVGRIMGSAALAALVLVIVFQDPRMHRYGSQVFGLAGLASIALAFHAGAIARTAIAGRYVALAGLVALAVIAAAVWQTAPGVAGQLVTDLLRLAPDPSRMAVLEARPLFLYSGQFSWSQPWEFFRTGFYAGLIALCAFTVRVVRDRRPVDMLVWVYAVTTFAATVGQNRFGYYLVTACALLGGWLAVALLDWGGVPHALDPSPAPRTRVPLAREFAVVAVAGGMFAPNVAPAILLAPRSASLSAYWQDVMTWLRRETPPPFAAGEGYYDARYPRDAVPLPDFTVMNWWDQGYWIVQRARRVPVSNPTQQRAPNAARFYVATDEPQALAVLRAERARFVLADWELPFRYNAEHIVMGRFQNVVDWAGATHARYYEIYYRREQNAWTPVWVFHEPYYRSMAYRLNVLGGAAAKPAHATTVLTVGDRTDPGGLQFREIVSENTFPTYESAQQAAALAGRDAIVVGLDPWQPAFPLERLTSFRERYAARTPEQPATEGPWVRVFEVIDTSR